jgi:hypothetical protein
MSGSTKVMSWTPAANSAIDAGQPRPPMPTMSTRLGSGTAGAMTSTVGSIMV